MDRNKETADFTQNKRSVLGKLIFVRINLNESVVGFLWPQDSLAKRRALDEILDQGGHTFIPFEPQCSSLDQKCL